MTDRFERSGLDSPELKYRRDQTRHPAGAPASAGGEFADEGRGRGKGGGGGGGTGSRRLGELSRGYESGREGPATVSSGKGDPGGVSYGTWQLATNRKRPEEFLETEGSRWAREFDRMRPGSPEFSERWRTIAMRDPAAFDAAQYEYIKRTHYDVAVQRIREKADVDVDTRSQTLRDVVWSTAVQHGPRKRFMPEAFNEVERRRGEDPYAYDSRVIERIYKLRGDDNPGTRRRFDKEVTAAGRMLDEERRRAGR